MNIRRRDRNADFYSSLAERDNPERLKAKRSSNNLFLVCALCVGLLLVWYILRMNENTAIVAETKEHVEYATNSTNIKTYEEKQIIVEKIKKINDYELASKEYLGQLGRSERFSKQWVEFFEGAMTNAIGVGNKITKYEYSENKVKLTCIATSPDKPKLYAQYLTELKNGEGKEKFPEIGYTGFRENGNGFEFELTVVLWKSGAPEGK